MVTLFPLDTRMFVLLSAFVCTSWEIAAATGRIDIGLSDQMHCVVIDFMPNADTMHNDCGLTKSHVE